MTRTSTDIRHKEYCASIALFQAPPAVAQAQESVAVFTPDGELKLPKGFRRWAFVGAPLTPNGLNGGAAGFPEFHNVYIQGQNVDAYVKTGRFPEGTVIVKELTRVLNPTFPDGSRVEPSGRGFFNGEFNGIDATVKDMTWVQFYPLLHERTAQTSWDTPQSR
jgi:hypothetical protein